MSPTEALKLVQPAAAPSAPVTWDPADVARFLKTNKELARRQIMALEAAGHAVRVPEAVAGRRVLVYASRFLRAAGMTDAEIAAALGRYT